MEVRRLRLFEVVEPLPRLDPAKVEQSGPAAGIAAEPVAAVTVALDGHQLRRLVRALVYAFAVFADLAVLEVDGESNFFLSLTVGICARSL